MKNEFVDCVFSFMLRNRTAERNDTSWVHCHNHQCYWRRQCTFTSCMNITKLSVSTSHPRGNHGWRFTARAQVVITFSAPIRFASKVEISIGEVKTYPEMYLMSSGYSSGKNYGGAKVFSKSEHLEKHQFLNFLTSGIESSLRILQKSYENLRGSTRWVL